MHGLTMLSFVNQARFAQEEMIRFWISTRRDRLLGLWAGRLLGHDGPDLDAYADEVVRRSLVKADEEEALSRVHADLLGRQVSLSAADLANKWDECMSRAREEILAQV